MIGSAAHQAGCGSNPRSAARLQASRLAGLIVRQIFYELVPRLRHGNAVMVYDGHRWIRTLSHDDLFFSIRYHIEAFLLSLQPKPKPQSQMNEEKQSQSQTAANESIGRAQDRIAAAEFHQELMAAQRKAGNAMNEAHIKRIKAFRLELDAILQDMKSLLDSREIALSHTRIQEAIMWLGMELKSSGTPNPYPHSYNPGNAIVDPTADGLKL